MNKEVSFSTQGHRADVGEYVVYRMLPNRYASAVGPFVFLDHIPPIRHSPEEPLKTTGTGAHPHRGIATLTYVLNGEDEHFDSRGNHATVRSGGAQWMKAGNGIIHDEAFNVDPQSGDRLTHGFQFWINLPAKNKAEPPEYIPVQSNEVPQYDFSDGKGWLKVVVGEYGGLASRIPGYSKQLLYHIHLNGGKQLSLPTESGLEYAAFLPLSNAVINGGEYRKGEFVQFGIADGAIEINNDSDVPVDVILFGGETYTEPIVARGPFVMNTDLEIAEAYRDYQAGKYGKIGASVIKA